MLMNFVKLQKSSQYQICGNGVIFYSMYVGKIKCIFSFSDAFNSFCAVSIECI